MRADLWTGLCLAALCLLTGVPRLQAQTGEPAASSPTDRLKDRDPQQRWDELNKPSVEARARPRRAVPRLTEQPEESATAQRQPDQPVYRTVSAPLPPRVAGGRRLLEKPEVPAETETVTAAAPTEAEDELTVYEAGLQGAAPPADSEPDPKVIKQFTTIMPYYDYEPDKSLRSTGTAFPANVAVSNQTYMTRAFPSEGYYWTPADTYHNPLYFDDNPLERYGHTRPFYVQPVVSVGKMVCQTFFLPYQITMNHPWRKHYTLGSYRPGACVPYRYYQVPLDGRAAAVQAGAVTGGFFLFGLY